MKESIEAEPVDSIETRNTEHASGVRLRRERYHRFVQRSEVPMLVLSALLIPIVLMPFVEDLSPESRRALEWLGLTIWAGFVAEYILMLYLSPHRFRTIRTHKLDLLLVALPLLRPLRLTRLLRLARAGTAFARAALALRTLAGRPGFGTVIGAVGGFILTGGGLVTIAEHDQPGSTISGFGDGLWWAFVTCTTVGYGDEFPVTTTGRFIAVVLMLAGISGLSVITANIAAFFVSADSQQDVNELADQLNRIESQLESLGQQRSADLDERS